MEGLLILGWPFVLVALVALQATLARRVILKRGVPDNPWSGILTASTVAAPFFAAAALWMRHVAQSALDNALHINRATTTVIVAGVRLPVFLAIRMAERTCIAMLLIAAIGAAVYFDFEFVTRRLRFVNIVLWSLAALTLAVTIGFFAMLMRMPRW